MQAEELLAHVRHVRWWVAFCTTNRCFKASCLSVSHQAKTGITPYIVHYNLLILPFSTIES
jgi:hypothetical protein